MAAPDALDHHRSDLHPPIMAEIRGNPHHQRIPYSSSSHRPNPHDINSYLLNSKASLEMLSNLCELSNWTWIDGILLGGCLHYGLENYDDALEWFNRIIKIDEKYVCYPMFLILLSN
jgi:hypothetical protein